MCCVKYATHRKMRLFSIRVPVVVKKRVPCAKCSNYLWKKYIVLTSSGKQLEVHLSCAKALIDRGIVEKLLFVFTRRV